MTARAVKAKAELKTIPANTVDKLHTIATWMQERSVEWASGIRMLLLCLITERHGFLLGPPGVGKSRVIRDLIRCLTGYDLFSKQLHPEMPLRELVGHMDIPAFIKDGVLKYVVHKSLIMQRGIAHLGEVWLANGSTGNGLLGVANEGEITLGSETHKTRVILIGDSNDMPDVVNVAEGDVKRKTRVALADRFLLREQVRPCVRSSANQNKLAWIESDRTDTGSVPCHVTGMEMDTLTNECRGMITNEQGFPKPMVVLLRQLVTALRKNGIRISDRRWIWAREVLAANALLDGRDCIAAKDLKTARYWGWLTPTHIPTVLEVLQDLVEMAYPKLIAEETACGKLYQDLLDKAKEDPDYFTNPSRVGSRIAEGNTVSAKLSDSIRTLNSMTASFPDEADEISAITDQIKGWNRDVLRRFVGIEGLDEEW